MFRAVYLYRAPPNVFGRLIAWLYLVYVPLKLLSVSALCGLSSEHFCSSYVFNGDDIGILYREIQLGRKLRRLTHSGFQIREVFASSLGYRALGGVGVLG